MINRLMSPSATTQHRVLWCLRRVDPGVALGGALVPRQFSDEGDDRLAKGRVFDANEGSMET